MGKKKGSKGQKPAKPEASDASSQPETARPQAEEQQQPPQQEQQQQQEEEKVGEKLMPQTVREFNQNNETAEVVAARAKLNPKSRRAAAAASGDGASAGSALAPSAAPTSEEAGKRDFHFYSGTGRSAPSTQQPFNYQPSKADDDYRMALDANKLHKAVRAAERKADEKYHNLLADLETRHDTLADDYERIKHTLNETKEELRGSKDTNAGYERDIAEIKQQLDDVQEHMGRFLKMEGEWKAEKKMLSELAEGRQRQLEKIINSARDANKKHQQTELANRTLHDQLDAERERADAATTLAEERETAQAELQQVNASLEEMFKDLGENLTAQDYINHVRDIILATKASPEGHQRHESASRERERGRIVSGSSMQDELTRGGWHGDAESETSEGPLDDLRMIELEAERDEAQRALAASRETEAEEKAMAESLRTELTQLQQEVQAGEMARERGQAEVEASRTKVRHLQQRFETVDAARKRGEERAVWMEREWRKAVGEGEAKVDRVRKAGTERVQALELELANARNPGGEVLSLSTVSVVETVPTPGFAIMYDGKIPGVLEVWGESPWYLKAAFWSAVGFYVALVLALLLEYSVWTQANDLTRQRILAITDRFAAPAPSQLATRIGEMLGVDFTVLG